MSKKILLVDDSKTALMLEQLILSAETELRDHQCTGRPGGGRESCGRIT